MRSPWLERADCGARLQSPEDVRAATIDAITALASLIEDTPGPLKRPIPPGIYRRLLAWRDDLRDEARVR